MTLQVGQRCAVYWYDGRFTGVVKEIHTPKFLVKFDSGQLKWAHIKQLRRLKPQKSKRREFRLGLRKEDDWWEVREEGLLASSAYTEIIRVREVLASTPRKGKFVTREMLAKAWDSVVYPTTHSWKANDSSNFKAFCKTLGLKESTHD